MTSERRYLEMEGNYTYETVYGAVFRATTEPRTRVQILEAINCDPQVTALRSWLSGPNTEDLKLLINGSAVENLVRAGLVARVRGNRYYTVSPDQIKQLFLPGFTPPSCLKSLR